MPEGMSKEKEFWNWFVFRSDDYFHNLDKNQNVLFDELIEKLNNINQHLTFVFSTIKKNNKREFVISANGIKSAFDSVINLVNSAPKIDNWEFIAFRPRIKGDIKIKQGDIDLGYDDIFFLYEINENKVDVDLYVKDFYEGEEFIGAVFILLDALLGEYDVETKIGNLDFFELDEDNKENLLDFRKLADVIDNSLV